MRKVAYMEIGVAKDYHGLAPRDSQKTLKESIGIQVQLLI